MKKWILHLLELAGLLICGWFILQFFWKPVRFQSVKNHIETRQLQEENEQVALDILGLSADSQPEIADSESNDKLLSTINSNRDTLGIPPLKTNPVLTKEAEGMLVLLDDNETVPTESALPDGSLRGQTVIRGSLSTEDILDAVSQSPEQTAQFYSRKYTEIGFARSPSRHICVVIFSS